MGINIIGGSATTTQDKTVVYGAPGTYTFTPPAGTSASNPLLCEVTVVGGGGGGGNYNTASAISGSGGGAGQVINQSSFYITGPTTVTVGAGGAAQTAGGNSSVGSLVALGGVAGAASTTATDKRFGTDDCTKGAAGTSALRLLGIGLSGTSSQIFFKDPNTLTTNNGQTLVSKPPLVSPQGEWSVATNGSHIIAANTYANGTNQGGNLTAFYSAGTGWTIRSVGTFADAFYGVGTINGVAVCFPGGSANTSTYYYATNGSNTWTTGNTGHAGASNSYTWLINLTAEQTELFVLRGQSNNLRRTTDGINWTNYTLPSAPTGGIYSGVGAIARLLGQSTYVYYSAVYVGNNTSVWTSPDLVTWTQRSTPAFGPNANAGNYGDYGIIAVGSYYWMAGAFSDSNYPNWFYSTNGYSWNAYTWSGDISRPSGPFNNHAFVKNGTWYSSAYSTGSTNYGVIRYGTFFPSTVWSAPEMTQNEHYGAIVEYSQPGLSNIAPTAFPGIVNMQPTGGSSGVPSAGGDGGNGGSYIAPTAKSTTASAAATPGQVPGSGGGGGGAGSTAGAAGAAGIVSIEYYG